ncbi:MAG: leucine-rich repeat protein [Lachnospiraceae bacterium]|jgi:hypothetical protein|nr:leucine-rich repeat protein [Lachnospiraceae bacterium]
MKKVGREKVEIRHKLYVFVKSLLIVLLILSIVNANFALPNNNNISANDVSTPDYDYNSVTKTLLIKTNKGLDLFGKDSKLVLNSIMTLRFSDNITSLSGKKIFEKCENICKIDLNQVTSIGDRVFENIKKVKEVDLSKVTSLGVGAFSGCTILSNVTLSEELKEISSEAFKGDKISSIDFKNVSNIGSDAFRENDFQTIDLKNVTSVDSSAFIKCKNLYKVNMGKVSSVGQFAFAEDSKLYDVSFPKEASYDMFAFSNCALDFSKGFPKGKSNEYSFINQNPKVYFSLDDTSKSIYPNESFELPTSIFKTKNGTELEKLIKDNPDWLSKDVKLPKVAITGDTLPTNEIGVHKTVYSIPSDIYANKYSEVFTLTVKRGDTKAVLVNSNTTFDKNATSKDYKDVPININLGSYQVNSVSLNNKEIKEGTDYVIAGSTYVFLKEYLSSLENGKAKFYFNMSDGSKLLSEINIVDTTVRDASVIPDEEIFNKTPGNEDNKEISVRLDANGNQVKSITNGKTTLVKDKEYKVDGDIYTFAKECFTSFAMGDICKIQFNMEKGKSPVVNVHIIETRESNPKISPVSAVYDKGDGAKYHTDMKVTVQTMNYELQGIKNGNNSLVKDKDYTISKSSENTDETSGDILEVLIKQSYLGTLDKGTIDLQFEFKDATPISMTLYVVDTGNSGAINKKENSNNTDTENNTSQNTEENNEKDLEKNSEINQNSDDSNEDISKEETGSRENTEQNITDGSKENLKNTKSNSIITSVSKTIGKVAKTFDKANIDPWMVIAIMSIIVGIANVVSLNRKAKREKK